MDAMQWQFAGPLLEHFRASCPFHRSLFLTMLFLRASFQHDPAPHILMAVWPTARLAARDLHALLLRAQLVDDAEVTPVSFRDSIALLKSDPFLRASCASQTGGIKLGAAAADFLAKPADLPLSIGPETTILIAFVHEHVQYILTNVLAEAGVLGQVFALLCRTQLVLSLNYVIHSSLVWPLAPPDTGSTSALQSGSTIFHLPFLQKVVDNADETSGPFARGLRSVPILIFAQVALTDFSRVWSPVLDAGSPESLSRALHSCVEACVRTRDWRDALQPLSSSYRTSTVYSAPQTRHNSAHVLTDVDESDSGRQNWTYLPPIVLLRVAQHFDVLLRADSALLLPPGRSSSARHTALALLMSLVARLHHAASSFDRAARYGAHAATIALHGLDPSNRGLQSRSLRMLFFEGLTTMMLALDATDCLVPTIVAPEAPEAPEARAARESSASSATATAAGASGIAGTSSSPLDVGPDADPALRLAHAASDAAADAARALSAPLVDAARAMMQTFVSATVDKGASSAQPRPHRGDDGSAGPAAPPRTAAHVLMASLPRPILRLSERATPPAIQDVQDVLFAYVPAHCLEDSHDKVLRVVQADLMGPKPPPPPPAPAPASPTPSMRSTSFTASTASRRPPPSNPSRRPSVVAELRHQRRLARRQQAIPADILPLFASVTTSKLVPGYRQTHLLRAFVRSLAARWSTAAVFPVVAALLQHRCPGLNLLAGADSASRLAHATRLSNSLASELSAAIAAGRFGDESTKLRTARRRPAFLSASEKDRRSLLSARFALLNESLPLFQQASPYGSAPRTLLLAYAVQAILRFVTETSIACVEDFGAVGGWRAVMLLAKFGVDHIFLSGDLACGSAIIGTAMRLARELPEHQYQTVLADVVFLLDAVRLPADQYSQRTVQLCHLSSALMFTPHVVACNSASVLFGAGVPLSDFGSIVLAETLRVRSDRRTHAPWLTLFLKACGRLYRRLDAPVSPSADGLPPFFGGSIAVESSNPTPQEVAAAYRIQPLLRTFDVFLAVLNNRPDVAIERAGFNTGIYRAARGMGARAVLGSFWDAVAAFLALRDVPGAQVDAAELAGLVADVESLGWSHMFSPYVVFLNAVKASQRAGCRPTSETAKSTVALFLQAAAAAANAKNMLLHALSYEFAARQAFDIPGLPELVPFLAHAAVEAYDLYACRSKRTALIIEFGPPPEFPPPVPAAAPSAY
jgi:hypothetical protein